jgi:hypothetical protein
MTRLDEALRGLDPVDPDEPVHADEALLARILRTPYPATPVRHRRRRAPLALLGAACAVAAGLVLLLPHGPRTDALAAAVHAVTRPNTILHFREQWTAPGTSVSPRQDLFQLEVWQAGDGSRERTIETSPGGASSEEVWSPAGTRTWVAKSHEIVVYDRRHAGRPPRPGAVGLSGHDIGDPRTLLQRARGGDARIIRLPDATVDGVPVRRFHVGRCHVVPGRSVRYAAVVSVSRETSLPVRVEQPPCRRAPAGQVGLTLEEQPGFTVDYVMFEVLPADRANRRLLDMSPHPGAKTVDGAAIDRAEARADRRRRGTRPSPTPTPTPTRSP